MSKRPILEIIPRLHYGKNSHDWWIHRNNYDFVKGIFLYPIRVGWQIIFEENNRQFYMHITEGHETSEIQPGYRCTSGSKYSDIESIPSVAITSLYQRLFPNIKTRFSGPLILGWNDEKLLERSLNNFPDVGTGNNKNKMGAGIGYTSSFIGEYGKKRALYLQKIEKNNSQIMIYLPEQNPIVFCGTIPDDTWKNTKLYKKFHGMQLFGLEYPMTQKVIQDKHFITCTPVAWNNEATIIELHEKLKKLYSSNHTFDDYELRAWRMMLKAVGCVNITLFEINKSKVNQNILQNLYNNGFLQAIPNHVTNIKSLNCNKNGNDSKIRILSIIANNFTYKELQNYLEVSSKTIAKARIYCNINRPGCSMLNRPIITRTRITEEMEDQFKKFFSDKNIMNLNSYRVDKNGLPLKYLKDKKETLWKKYSELYPNGIKRTTFLTKLQKNPYLYKDNLGGLYH
ncbi:hypothetical protein Glove_332g31 [Diversispora epigaea]|uniref:Uncharacterized protein n=1 Tax=Diversispora epigaea TaxID=1348612 RepID=A0A397HJM5_9GLOM|nr:hypothetical protein Glove_332g31 [Diversispora epigaea]